MGHGRAIDAHVEAKGEDGEITLVFELQGPALDIAIEQAGVMPLPPYIAGKRSADARDESDYQTIFAREAGAVAAPTAGLHFTPQLLAAIEARGVRLYRVTLHVGAGTFLPVKAEDTDLHRMHEEFARLDAETAQALNDVRAGGGALCRAHADLHYARLSFPRRGHAAHQFPSPALDALHAGRRIRRPRAHEGRLCACHQKRLSLLFLWRRLCASAFRNMSEPGDMRILALWRDDPREAPMTIDARIDDARIVSTWDLFGAFALDGDSVRPFILRRDGRIDFGLGESWRSDLREAT
ncbi:MAG: queA, partial [Methylocystaceae bacterium]